MGKKSSKTAQKTIYGNTTTTNPYVTSSTNNKGTTSAFNKGTAYDTLGNFVNNSMNTLLDQYLNPTLNSVTNQAKLNNFTNTLNEETSKNLENNIINPLSKRNMLRSSQATNMYNNLAQNNVNQLATFTNDLLANSQNDTATILNNLLNWYASGYNILADTQNQSLATSKGNATTTQNTVSKASGMEITKMAIDSVLGIINAIKPTGGNTTKT